MLKSHIWSGGYHTGQLTHFHHRRKLRWSVFLNASSCAEEHNGETEQVFLYTLSGRWRCVSSNLLLALGSSLLQFSLSLILPYLDYCSGCLSAPNFCTCLLLTCSSEANFPRPASPSSYCLSTVTRYTPGGPAWMALQEVMSSSPVSSPALT